MRYLKTLLLAAVAATTTGLAAQQQPQTPASPDIRAFLQVTTDFCSGGQPRPDHFATLKANGV